MRTKMPETSGGQNHPLPALFPLRQTGKPWGPIWLHEGMILDGRGLARACRKACVEPEYRVWQGEGGGPIGFLMAQNFHRRSLTTTQRAFIAAAAMPHLTKEAASRRKATQNKKGRKHAGGPDRQKFASQVDQGRARDIAAKAAGVSGETVRQAGKVLSSNCPPLIDAVKAGEIPISRGARVASVLHGLTPEQQIARIREDEAKARKTAAKTRREAQEDLDLAADKSMRKAMRRAAAAGRTIEEVLERVRKEDAEKAATKGNRAVMDAAARVSAN